jgi:very-short-patch-repair endonuclease
MGGAGGGRFMPINLTHTAKELRKQSTDAERLLWRHLRAKQMEGLKFRRQEQIGRFIADFVCYEKMIIVEADGGQHALEVEKDEERTLWLNAQGFTVLRFWNHEILTNREGVLETIRSRCL